MTEKIVGDARQVLPQAEKNKYLLQTELTLENKLLELEK